ncbi:hypothetical protein O4G98_20765 [Zoogloeaceae bacterium G21618-S1]|jgi:hypothetical protein|nr:hypothetical protein [Zoogloeaceae bacterium G21618-S1]
MANIPDQILIAVTVAYMVAMVIVFFKAIRHFYGWFINSTPPMGKLGPLVEGFTMFFPRYLTREGVDERNKFAKWFSIAFVMGVSFVIAVELAGSYAT